MENSGNIDFLKSHQKLMNILNDISGLFKLVAISIYLGY